MGITRGAQTIVDRKEGWGHTDGTDAHRKDDGNRTAAIVATDASKEATATRLGRLLKDRKDSAPTGVDDADRDLAYTDSTEVAIQTSDTEATMNGRPRETRDTVSLDDSNATERAESAKTSIRDRTDGWGHTDGSFTYRKDS
jgi:hypothetical protein